MTKTKTFSYTVSIEGFSLGDEEEIRDLVQSDLKDRTPLWPQAKIHDIFFDTIGVSYEDTVEPAVTYVVGVPMTEKEMREAERMVALEAKARSISKSRGIPLPDARVLARYEGVE